MCTCKYTIEHGGEGSIERVEQVLRGGGAHIEIGVGHILRLGWSKY